MRKCDLSSILNVKSTSLHLQRSYTLVGERENVSNHESRDAYEYSNVHIHQTNTTEHKQSNIKMSWDKRWSKRE